MSTLEGVKGLLGYWHITDNSWDKSGNKLNTLCGTSISPNYRRRNTNSTTCPKCRKLFKESKEANKWQDKVVLREPVLV